MEPGSVCDTVPEFHQDKSLVWVEYPGIVKNVDKMLKTLGGQKNITSTYKEAKKRLDLRFRPDDPCCHPVCGDKTPTAALLLKVRKYRKKKKPGESSKPDEFRYIPEIVGVIEECYKFNGLCDFQYLPLYNDVENDTLVNMIPHLQVTDLDESVYTKDDAPLFLPPATFSRFDQQQDVLFRKEPKFRKRAPPAQGEPDTISVTRPKRAHFAQYIKYEDDWTPKEALPEARQNLERLSSEDTKLLDSVRELFEKRPIWSKTALVCTLKTRHERLKNILPGIAYYFITGPWRSLWVKLGYDPRKKPEAAQYQLLDFRVRQGINTPNIPIKAKRSTLSYRLPNLMPRSRSTKSNVNEPSSTRSKSGRAFGDAVYIYKPGTLPAYRQTFYQVCDIQHPAVIEILKSCESNSTATECDAKSGWLPEDTAAKMRDILTSDIQQIIATRENVQMKDMFRDGRKTSLLKKNQNQEEGEILENEEDDESLLDLGHLPESSTDEEEQDVESGDEGSPAVILDSILEEGDGDFEFNYPEGADEEESGLNLEEDFEATSGDLFGGVGDDIADFMADFDAYAPENLLEEDDEIVE